jgi:hypothetical protein
MLFRDENRPAGSVTQCLQEVIECNGWQAPTSAGNRRANLSCTLANQERNKEDTSTEAQYIDCWLNLVQNVSP